MCRRSACQVRTGVEALPARGALMHTKAAPEGHGYLGGVPSWPEVFRRPSDDRLRSPEQPSDDSQIRIVGRENLGPVRLDRLSTGAYPSDEWQPCNYMGVRRRNWEPPLWVTPRQPTPSDRRRFSCLMFELASRSVALVRHEANDRLLSLD